MKYALVLMALVFAGCSSADKTTETKPTEAPKAEASKTATAAPAAKKETKAASTSAAGEKVVCKLGDIQRDISITQKDGNCVVEYTKDGSTNEIATGLANSSFCKEVQDRVKNNLSAAGYSCN